LNNQELCWSI